MGKSKHKTHCSVSNDSPRTPKSLKLKRRGQFLEGEILDSWLKEREKKLLLTVRYCFTSPNGRQLKGKQTKQRDDLIYFEPPPVGTPVRVLYADDQTHIIL